MFGRLLMFFMSFFLLAIVLSVLLWFFWSLYCLPFFFSFGHCIVCPSFFLLAIILSVLLFFFWPLYCLSFFVLRILILASSHFYLDTCLILLDIYTTPEFAKHKSRTIFIKRRTFLCYSHLEYWRKKYLHMWSTAKHQENNIQLLREQVVPYALSQ